MRVKATPKLFSDAQWSQVMALLAELEPAQKWWLSGYLAAAEGEPLVSRSTGSTQAGVLIAFGTETGNCKQLAEDLAVDCRSQGIAVELADLARVKPRQLSRTPYLVVIVATHGDGDPPETMVPFYEAFMGDGAPALSELQFSVLALGDSTYDHFCVTGRQLDERLEGLGATRLLPRVECDVDYAKPAREWMDRLLPLLPQQASLEPVEPMAAVASVACDKNNPLAVELIVNTRLSAANRTQPIYHLELAVDNAVLALEPGDAVGVLVDNPPALVAAVLDACGVSGESPVTLDGEAMPLVQALRQHRDLTIPGAGFLDLWAEISGDEVLTAIRDSETKIRRTFLRGHQILELLRRFPANPGAQDLIEALRPLQPRLYDAANYLAADDDELHLTVQAYSYPFGNQTVDGIASHYLASLEPGEEIRIYPHRNRRFQLPGDREAPLILVAEGTGLAPYRAFWEFLSESEQRPPCWLVFGEQSFEEDFLYQLDILRMRDEGILQEVDTVFRLDHPGRTLADPLLDRYEIVSVWLDRGAHLYLCGEKERLEVCEDALRRHSDAVAGEGVWKSLTKDRRIHRNLY